VPSAPRTATVDRRPSPVDAGVPVAALLDAGSFTTTGARHGPTVNGVGTIERRTVHVHARDGSAGDGTAADLTARTIEEAARRGRPVVGIDVSSGPPNHGVPGESAAHARLAAASTAASTRVPQIALLLGASTGAPALTAALADITIMTDDASTALTDRRATAAATGEGVDIRSLGGAEVHAERSGSAHLVVDDADQAFALTREVLGHLPDASWIDPPSVAPVGPPPPLPRHLIEGDGHLADRRDLVRALVDDGRFLELQGGWAPNLVIGLARIEGRSVGVIANQPRWLGGTIDLAAAEKGARFVRFCDTFGLPVVTFVDVPGFRPGTTQEHGGALRRSADLLRAFVATTVPRVTVVLGDAAGAAGLAMCSRAADTDALLAWSHARLDGRPAPDAVRRGDVDEVVDPARTRPAIAARLRALQRGRGPLAGTSVGAP
jgi:acetyl-CoA carboxylase carboxyltransferase component